MAVTPSPSRQVGTLPAHSKFKRVAAELLQLATHFRTTEIVTLDGYCFE